MCDDGDMSSMDMLVRLNEMGSYDRPEELRGRDWMLLCHYIDCILHCISRNDDAVIGFGIAT